MATHVDLYRKLEPVVGPEAAQMIADAIPPAGEAVSKNDMRGAIQELRADIFRWGLAAVIPLWIGVWGAFLTLLIAVLRHSP